MYFWRGKSGKCFTNCKDSSKIFLSMFSKLLEMNKNEANSKVFKCISMPDFKLKSYTVSIMASALTILLQYLQSAINVVLFIQTICLNKTQDSPEQMCAHRFQG